MAEDKKQKTLKHGSWAYTIVCEIGVY